MRESLEVDDWSNGRYLAETGNATIQDNSSRLYLSHINLTAVISTWRLLHCKIPGPGGRTPGPPTRVSLPTGATCSTSPGKCQTATSTALVSPGPTTLKVYISLSRSPGSVLESMGWPSTLLASSTLRRASDTSRTRLMELEG